MRPHLAYFVHDLGDAAVARRVRMLHAGGMQVTIIGFHRHGVPPASIDGARTVDLGRTTDGRLVQRSWAVLRNLLRFERADAATRGCDVVMARNLEMLVIAKRARRGRRLVYECLDIHRLLLRRGMVARGVQALERRLLRETDLVITSSSRFIDAYFRPRQLTAAPLLLVENKVLALSDQPRVVDPLPPGPPWVIGWFGMLRCRRSLQLLIDMAKSGKGRLEVVLAGVPAQRELGDLFDVAVATPGITWLGRYRAEDLAQLYGGVHFAWAIDFFEEGLNSAWLMPNRLYEALAHGAVPIALAGVETGAWLRRHAVGAVVENVQGVAARLADIDQTAFAALRTAVATLPRSAVTIGPAGCHELAASIADRPYAMRAVA